MPQPLPSRAVCNASEPASAFWDVEEMRAGVPRLLEAMPSECGGKIDLLFGHRDTRRAARGALAFIRKCSAAQHASEMARFVDAKYVSTWRADDRREPPTAALGALVSREAAAFDRPVCAWLDNYVQRSVESRRALHRDFEHLETSSRFREMASQTYPLSTLLVVHMRSDENFCRNTVVAERLVKTHACLVRYIRRAPLLRCAARARLS
jgi:hypothetical protein